MAVPFFVLQKERKQCYRKKKILEDLSDFEIKTHTGLPWWAVREVIELYSPLQGSRRTSIPLETKVLCFLSYLRSGSFQYILASSFGTTQSKVSDIIAECFNRTLELAPSIIHFKNPEESLYERKVKFHDTASFPNIIGVIDGTHVAITAPHTDPHLYVNRKRYHSINCQVVVDSEYRFLDVVAKCKPNWSEEETLALAKSATPYAGILDGSIKVPPIKKFAIWQHITKQVNIAGGGSRSMKEVQVKHKNVKSAGKKKEVHNRREIGKTGGGPSNVEELSVAEELMVSTIGEASLSGIPGGIDTNDESFLLSKRTTLETVEARSSGNLLATDEEVAISVEGIDTNGKQLVGKRMPNVPSSDCDAVSGPSAQKRVRKSIEKSPTEILLEDQVKLLQEQVKCFYKIIDLMVERNAIEKQKCNALQNKILVDVQDVE